MRVTPSRFFLVVREKITVFSKSFSPKKITANIFYIRGEFGGFLKFLEIYIKDKIFFFSRNFEANKNIVVKGILIKRGRGNRMFLHLSAMGVLIFGIVISPFIRDSSPFKDQKDNLAGALATASTPYELTSEVFETEISEKPRDKIIDYEVERGDTISTIARKFGVSEDTIRWENNLTGDRITEGDELRILPVTGMAHKVEAGNTVYSIAQKYQTNAQEIVDFPFNDFANPQTFSLVVGQILIVPNGVKPAEAPKYARKVYIAGGPTIVTPTGFTWPASGPIFQFYSWYHKGIDIGGDTGDPVVAGQNGRASEVYTSGWHGGYGTHVIVLGENGYSTLYAHMSGVNVSPGDEVVAGKTILGWIGTTGRTTGPHLHLEIRGGSGLLNPLSFLK